ncbi:MAG: hypothetical protein KAG98_02060, partial [Lentisphaeria bacterium]|nr:hypothetical protein [Lentisphaeria bacterium]
MIKLFRGIHKFYSTGRWVLRIVVSVHLLVLLYLFVGDFFLNIFKKKKVVYQVQIVSTGDLNPQSASKSPSSETPVKPKDSTPPKKKVTPKKKTVVKPKRVTPKKKAVVKPKRVTPKKKTV